MLEKLLSPRAELVYTVLRVAAGLMFGFHGVQKIFRVLTDHPPAVGSQLWFGGLIEIGCGAAIALGLGTRTAAFLASGTMAVAYIQFHWRMQLDARFFPTVNRGELALVYCLLFLYFACRGGGTFSVDRLLAQRSRPRPP